MLGQLTESEAKAYHSIAYKTKPWTIYRKVKDGSYRSIGKLCWNLNYNAIPVKQKYWPLIYFSMNTVI